MDVSKNGNVWPDNDNSDAYTVRGADMSMGDAGVKTGFDPGAPVWTDAKDLSADATNSMGGISGDTHSDPMFDRFKMEGDQPNHANASNSRDPSVASSDLAGTESDPEFERYPNPSSIENDTK